MSPEFAKVLERQHEEHLEVLEKMHVARFTPRELWRLLNLYQKQRTYLRVWTLCKQMYKRGMLLREETDRLGSYRYYRNPDYNP